MNIRPDAVFGGGVVVDAEDAVDVDLDPRLLEHLAPRGFEDRLAGSMPPAGRYQLWSLLSWMRTNSSPRRMTTIA